MARWFADRSDMILILFDAHRLDVSDELMEVLDTVLFFRLLVVTHQLQFDNDVNLNIGSRLRIRIECFFLEGVGRASRS